MAERFKGNTETLVSLLLDVHSRGPTVQHTTDVSCTHQDLVKGRHNLICAASERPS